MAKKLKTAQVGMNTSNFKNVIMHRAYTPFVPTGQRNLSQDIKQKDMKKMAKGGKNLPTGSAKNAAYNNLATKAYKAGGMKKYQSEGTVDNSFKTRMDETIKNYPYPVKTDKTTLNRPKPMIKPTPNRFSIGEQKKKMQKKASEKIKEFISEPRVKTMLKPMKKGGFPDLNKDGKITKADILKGRGVFKKGGEPKLGSGERFKKLSGSVAQQYMKKGKSAEEAKKIGAAVAAVAGRKKYGPKKMASMAKAGKKG